MLVRVVASLALSILTGGCMRRGESRSDQCWRQLHFAQATGGDRGRSEIADALERQRCTALDQEERREARLSRAERREAARQAEADLAASEARASAERQATQAEQARIRRAPKAPELGGTVAEAETLCAVQRGAVSRADSAVSCTVGRAKIFVCAANGIRLTRCDVYHEGGDLAAFRALNEERFGSPTSETVSPKGFRVFHWKVGETMVAVTMYERGVRTTVMRERPPGEMGADADAGAGDVNPYR